jgi:hypothetical protein
LFSFAHVCLVFVFASVRPSPFVCLLVVHKLTVVFVISIWILCALLLSFFLACRYKGVALESCPEMMFLGMQDQFFTFNMFDAQAWWVRDVILQRIQVPGSLEERVADSEPWRVREAGLGKYSELQYSAGQCKTAAHEDTCFLDELMFTVALQRLCTDSLCFYYCLLKTSNCLFLIANYCFT